MIIFAASEGVPFAAKEGLRQSRGAGDPVIPPAHRQHGLNGLKRERKTELNHPLSIYSLLYYNVLQCMSSMSHRKGIQEQSHKPIDTPAKKKKKKLPQCRHTHDSILYVLYAHPRIFEYASSTSLATSSSVTMMIWCVMFGSLSRCSPIHSSGGVASPMSRSCGVSISGGSRAR